MDWYGNIGWNIGEFEEIERYLNITNSCLSSKENALCAVDQDMEKLRKLLAVKKQQSEREQLRNIRISKTLNRQGERLSFLHVKNNGMKFDKMIKNI